MNNIYQFSAAKNVAENTMLQTLAGQAKNYDDFLNDAEQVADIFNKTWLRTEYDVCRRGAVMADGWRSMEENADLYPYWVYRGVMDDVEREEHVALEGLVFRIGDPEGDDCYPYNGWNCRCSADPVDESYVSENRDMVREGDDAAKEMDENIDEQWQFNSGKGGVLPRNDYFETVDPNNLNYKNYGKDIDEGEDLELMAKLTLASQMLAYTQIVQDWRNKYHVDKKGAIVFQNDKLLSNVKFTDNSYHTVIKHGNGMANIPGTIAKPDEVWSQGDKNNVFRSYIKFGNGNSYVVQTHNAVVTDAFVKVNPNKYRKGVLL